MNKGRLIVVSGPSGTGKGTICKALCEACPELALSVSWTTREIRPGEEAGVTYHYKTEQEYDELIAQNGFLEHAGIYGGRYGTPRPFVEENIFAGKDVILEIEMQGAKQVMELGLYETISIFILPPSMKELRRRLIERGREDEEKALKRFAKAKEEITLADEYDFIVVNDGLADAVEQLKNIIAVTKLTPARASGHIAMLKEEIV